MDREKIVEKTNDEIHSAVKEKYSTIAKGDALGCASSCCGGSPSLVNIMDLGKALDYAEKDLSLAPGEANLGLGCGNPISRADLKAGETVLDLGIGTGFDAFLCSMKVGKGGHVIGVDMTPEMVTKAKDNAEKLGIKNVEFKHGDIERLPVDDNSVDVILSNCVINLSPNKQAVFQEAFRV